jgi:RNA polymerase sigma factor (TIGR02999 family)
MAEAFANILEQARLGDDSAREAVYRLAFQRLRRIATSLLRHERANHTLQPTALISELFLKLLRFESSIVDENHFFRLAARAMRQVLIDHARCRQKGRKVSLDRVSEILSDRNRQDDTAFAVRIAFERLRGMDSQVAGTLWLRSIEGLTAVEISRTQKRELWRVRADCDFGLQWMADQLGRDA